MTLILSRDELRSLLTMEDCIAALERAHAEHARRRVIMPLRMRMAYPERLGRMVLMPAILKDTDVMGIKVHCTFGGNPEKGLPLAMGLVILEDAHTGEPLLIIDSATVTQLRTAAASAVATKHLARPDTRVLAILGAGIQGRTHLAAMKAVRPVERVQVWSRTRANATQYAKEMAARHALPIAVCDTPEQAVRGADLVCAASAAKTPIVEGAWLTPGAHVNGVGSLALDARELDSAAIATSRVFVDALDVVPHECGDIMIPVGEGRIALEHVAGEIGEVIIGAKPGRASPDEVTIYKSVGVGMQDVAAAHLVYEKALRSGVGTRVRI